MSTALYFLIAALAATGTWFAIAPRGRSTSAPQLGRKWLAGVWAFVVFFVVPQVLRTGDLATVRGALLLLAVVGVIAFALGYLIGRFRKLQTSTASPIK